MTDHAEQLSPVENANRGGWGKSLTKIAISLALTAIVFYLVCPDRARFDAFLEATKTIHLGWVTLSVAMVIGNRVLMTAKWWSILRMQGIHLRLWGLVKIQFTSYFLGTLLPGMIGADVVRSFILARAHSHKAEALASVAVDRITSVAAMAFVATIGVLAVDLPIGAELKVIVLGFALAGVASIAAIFLAANAAARWTRKLADGRSGRIRSVLDKLEKLFSALAIYHKSPATIIVALLFGVGVQLVRCVGIYLLFLALGHSELLLVCLALVPVQMVVSLVAPAITTTALNAGAMVVLFGRVGVPESDALIVSIINSMAVFALIPIGAVCYWLGDSDLTPRTKNAVANPVAQ